MLQIYCDVCHGLLKLNDDKSFAVCEACKNTVSVPAGYTELESSFCFAAEARSRRDFGTAVQTYSEILNRYPNNAGALWGRALSRFEIEYQPAANGEYRLVCHKASEGDFLDDSDVLSAIRLSDGDEAKKYRAEAEKITALQTAIELVASAVQQCDVIVVSSDEEKSKEEAEKLCTALTASGMRVFCPNINLSQIPQSDWEAYLYHAFNKADAMVLVACTKNAFTPDVCFSAERFLYRKTEAVRLASEQTPLLALAFSELDEYTDIPDAIFDGADERFSMKSDDYAAELADFIKNGTLDYSKGLRKQAAGSGDYDYTNLISRARVELEGGNFDNAVKLYNEVLSINAYSSQAYWGMLLASKRCVNEDALILLGEDIRQDKNYKSALAFASEREQQLYKSVADRVDETIYANNQAEIRQAREEDEKRKKKSEIETEIKAAGKATEKAEERAGKLKNLVLVLLAVSAIVAGVAGYNSFKSGNKQNELYQEGVKLYNSKEYYEAAEVFSELGDYKDSAEMYENSMSNYSVNLYQTAVRDGNDLNNRITAVKQLFSVSDYVPAAKERIEEWLNEGKQYYENRQYHEAYLALTGFNTDYEEYFDVWRLTLNQGVIACGGTKAAMINMYTGELDTEGFGEFEAEHTHARSVSLSRSGSSAAIVTTGGEVALYGKIAGLYDVSAQNIINVKTTDTAVAYMNSDGELFASFKGSLPIASDVMQYAIYDSTVIAVLADGSVYCSDNEINDGVSDWKNIVYAATNGKSAAGVTRSGNIVSFGTEEPIAYIPEEKFVAVLSDGTDYAFIRADNCLFSKDYRGGYTSVHLAAFGSGCEIYVDRQNYARAGGAMKNEMTGAAVNFRKACQRFSDMGIPPLGE